MSTLTALEFCTSMGKDLSSSHQLNSPFFSLLLVLHSSDTLISWTSSMKGWWGSSTSHATTASVVFSSFQRMYPGKICSMMERRHQSVLRTHPPCSYT